MWLVKGGDENFSTDHMANEKKSWTVFWKLNGSGTQWEKCFSNHVQDPRWLKIFSFLPSLPFIKPITEPSSSSSCWSPPSVWMGRRKIENTTLFEMWSDKRGELYKACNTHGRYKKLNPVLTWKLEGKRPLGKRTHKWEGKIKGLLGAELDSNVYDKSYWQTVQSIVMNPWILWKAPTEWLCNFSRMILFHGVCL
jgi:hypothetical protein